MIYDLENGTVEAIQEGHDREAAVACLFPAFRRVNQVRASDCHGFELGLCQSCQAVHSIGGEQDRS